MALYIPILMERTVMSTPKGFRLGAHICHVVRQLPVTAMILAMATLISTVFFHFSNNVINISLIFIVAIVFIARATNCYTCLLYTSRCV